ncbi:MAG TPA: ATPase, T2SS/T4P/T4SS family [Bryobacteraceae bacterium]|nr:ATPase, T2SS/T4P/T4SS family [Bryobacteraceae bacterium]
MAATGTARIQVSLDPLSPGAATDELLAAILRANPRVSDLIFSPGKKFQIQVNGEFVELEMSGMPPLTADDTRRVASELIANNKSALSMLREQGYCDVSYALPGVARFRVNIFIQRGSCAVVMRVIPTTVPDFKSLALPEELHDIAGLHDGLVLITGPRGSGKSSTLAALLDHINENETCHIITIEDPIEFLHNHKRSTIHQRELHSDTPSVLQALSAALRQAPNVIAVGELKDPATMELALEAAETGHLVLSTMNTINPQQAVQRFVSALPAGEQRPARDRLTRMLRYVISQRLVPRKQDEHRMAVFEVWKSGSEPLDRLLRNESHRRSDDAQYPETTADWSIDSQIEELVQSGIVTPEIAVTHAMDPRALAKKLGLSER